MICLSASDRAEGIVEERMSWTDGHLVNNGLLVDEEAMRKWLIATMFWLSISLAVEATIID